MSEDGAQLPTRRTLDQRVTLIGGVLLAVTSALAIIAWLPDLVGKEQEIAAFASLKDNPTGILVVRDLGVAGPGVHRYDINYTVLLKNTANNDFDVVWSMDQLFVGTIRVDNSNLETRVVNDPPDRFDRSTGDSDSLLKWDEKNYDLSKEDQWVSSEFDAEFIKSEKRIITSPNGGLTGPVAPGAFSTHFAHYELVARPDNYVSVAISYGFKRPRNWWQRLRYEEQSPVDDDQKGYHEMIRLSDSNLIDCKLGLVVQNNVIRSACNKSDY